MLAIDAISQPFAMRIQLLRKLLKARSKIDNNEIDSLCKELDELRLKRNIVAHNPVVADASGDNTNCKILAIRYKEGRVDIPNELCEDDVNALVGRSSLAMVRLIKLILESTKT